MKISIIGTGYVELVSGACFADVGTTVLCLDGADADVPVLVTEWIKFRAPDFGMLAQSLRCKAIFDGRNIYDPQTVAAAGLSYHGIGRTSEDTRV